MNRRGFLASLAVAPVAITTIRPEPNLMTERFMTRDAYGRWPNLQVIGIAGHDIKHGETVWMRLDDWNKLSSQVKQGILSDVR